MKLVSIPANPVPDNFVTGMLKTPDGVALALCALAAAGRPPRHGVHLSGPQPNGSRNISRRCAICARAVLPSRRSTGAARACPIARSATGARAMCATSPNTTAISKPSCARSCCRIVRRRSSRSAIPPARSVLIRAAHRGHRWFDRMVLTAPMIDARRRRLFARRPVRSSCARCGWRASAPCMCRRPTPASSNRGPFVGNILTSDPVRYARNAAILEAEPALALGAPTVAWMDAAFRAMRAMRERSYPARIRQPILIVAGGSDAVVSNAGDRGFRQHAARRLASGRRRRQARDC